MGSYDMGGLNPLRRAAIIFPGVAWEVEFVGAQVGGKGQGVYRIMTKRIQSRCKMNNQLR